MFVIDPNAIYTLDDDQAGWGVGLCEGRPERTSALGWGRFERVKEV